MQRITGIIRNFMQTHNITPMQPVAVAVSGGCDSMALALATQTYFDPNSIHILTVDHRIRSESSDEARSVKNMLAEHDFISHKIINIRWPFGELPPTNKLEVRSREARYENLLSFCQINKIKVLFTAHHKFDQIETCLHRLIMGSSIDGLHGMLPSVVFGTHPEITILRPFLDENKEDLQQICKDKELNWVTDPTNFSPLFNRSCLRHILSQNASLANTLNSVINFSKEFCEETNPKVLDFLENNCFLEPKLGYYYIQWSKFLQLPKTIAIRVLTNCSNFFIKDRTAKHNLVTLNSSNSYSYLRYAKKFNLHKKSSLSFTIIATLIEKDDRLYIGKSKSYERLDIRVGETVTWDNRFLITLVDRDSTRPVNQKFTIRSMVRTDQTFLFRAVRRIKASRLPLIHYRYSLPVIVTEDDQIVFMPHFGYRDFDYNVECTCKHIANPLSIHKLPPRRSNKRKRELPEN